jgi:hypothetical protein
LCHRCSKRKIVNQILVIAAAKHIEKAEENKGLDKASLNRHPWYWEGNVQKRLLDWLQKNGHEIHSFSDTASRSGGVDIVAKDATGSQIWITVKGYPETLRNVQARHYFANAIFDLILYRGESASVQLGIALPEGFPTYKNLAKKVQWLREEIFPFDIYWINEDGRVRKE